VAALLHGNDLLSSLCCPEYYKQDLMRGEKREEGKKGRMNKYERMGIGSVSKDLGRLLGKQK
jgi:hypothetical protein